MLKKCALLLALGAMGALSGYGATIAATSVADAAKDGDRDRCKRC